MTREPDVNISMMIWWLQVHTSRRLWAAVGAVMLVSGLGIGLWPVHVYDGTACGSAFIPETVSDDNPWPEMLGYTETFPTLNLSAEFCDRRTATQRVGALSLVLPGAAVLGGVGWAARGRRREAAGPDVMPPAAAEQYWRSQGWAPEHELQTPPPGWRRVDS
jgi:hypothetical protein